MLMAAAALVLTATAASGDIGPPVKVELLGPPRAALPGEVFKGELRITSGVPAEVKDVRLAGEGWGAARVDVLAPVQMDKGAALLVPFEVQCASSEKWLTVSFLWNGRTVRKDLDVSERSARYAREGIPVTTFPEGEPALKESLPQVKPDPVIPEGAKAPEPGALKHTIRVRGRFVYMRPDNVSLGVDGLSVDIYDEDSGVDDFIAGTVTGWDGNFDTTFEFSDSYEDYPDIYIKFRACNAEAEIEHPTSGAIYTWETDVTPDVTSYLNIGTIYSADESVTPALHLITSMSRNWRWFIGYGYDPRYVEVEWPDGDEGAWYTPVSEEIHISSEWEWSDQVPTHEHGHHWMECYDSTPSPYYCNHICDDNYPTDCGHCLWCEEDSEIAWSEGLPDFLAYAVPMEYVSRYGIAAADTMWVQGLDTCTGPGGSGTYDPPTITEGFVAAMLVDIYDDYQDSHPAYAPWRDRLELGPEEILDCADDHNPTTVGGFLFAFKADYPAVKGDFWETAADCGYDVDEDPPGTPTTLLCLSHTSGVESPDATVDMEWSLPTDDASGVDAYSWEFRSGSAALPNQTIDGYTNSCTSATLAPGTYFFSVRAHDRSGRWATTFASWGPIVIREADPENLTDYARVGWDYPLVPTSSSGSTSGSAHVSATLPGNTSGTYWNIAGQNDGESATSAGFTGAVYVDDVYKQQCSWSAVAAGTNFYTTNRGPFNAPGGRHTLHGVYDASEVLAETDETDNDWGHQFVWTPYHLTADVARSQSSIEHMLSGWEHVHDGSTLYYNSWGFRFDNSGWWNACVVWAHDNDNNYDVRMHAASTGATSGFTTALTTSSLSGGKIDAVIVNRNVTATAEFDVGVIYYGTAADLGFDVLHVENDYADFDYTTTTTLGPDGWLGLYEFEVFPDHVGPVSVIVWSDPPTANVHVQWRPEDFLYGGLANCSAEAVTGADGRAVLQFEVSETGMNNLCVYRHPKDGETPAEVSFLIVRTPPDLAPATPAGWHAGLVPLPAADGTPTSVPEPDTLNGNSNSTYYNVAVQNLTAGAGDSVRAYVWLDGESHAGLLYPTFPGDATLKYNYSFPYSVRGGRHCLSLNIDPYYRVLETNDRNNVFGEQYAWSPYSLTQGYVTIRSAPPAIHGGWLYMTTGDPLWYNCDGLRLSGLTNWWAAMAVMPGDTSNVDVRLHPMLVGVKDGFASNLAYSSWGKAASDYVLVNFNLVTRNSYDAGVTSVTGGQNYTAHCTQSSYLGTRPSGVFGPYSLGANGIVRLHEMHLDAGTYAFTLQNAQGNVNWGMCLHPNNQPYLQKSLVVANGAAWLNGPGAAETFTVELTEDDYYCLAIWKCGAADLPLTGQYTIQITPIAVDVVQESGIPGSTRLAGVWPNPFNPLTTVAFDLAEQSPVALTIYDLTGARVRSLLEGRRPAGRHRVAWDGCDDRGRRVASGVYILQMLAGELRESRKLVMLK
jgi:hypothetical protein